MRSTWIIPASLFAILIAPVLAASDPLEAPFDFLHNQIVLHPALNGEGPFNFLLDTGTDLSSIDVRLARRLHLPLTSTKSESSGVGSKRAFARHTVCNELKLAGLTVKDLRMAALDLSRVSEQLGRPVHGVLGYSFLASRIVQIDYFQRRIRFYSDPPTAAAVAASRISFPMRFRAGSILPVLENCYINGSRIPITIDTGSSLGLILFQEAIRRLGLEQLAREGLPLSATGYRGKALLMKGWVKSVVFDSVDLGAIEAAYAVSGYGEAEEIERRGGNLGNAVLQDFILTLDYRGRTVVMERIEQ